MRSGLCKEQNNLKGTGLVNVIDKYYFLKGMIFRENIMNKNMRIDEHLISAEPFYLPMGDEVKLAEAAYKAGIPLLLKGSTGCAARSCQ